MRASSPALVTITAKGEGGQRKIGAIEDHVPPGHPRLWHASTLKPTIAGWL